MIVALTSACFQLERFFKMPISLASLTKLSPDHLREIRPLVGDTVVSVLASDLVDFLIASTAPTPTPPLLELTVEATPSEKPLSEKIGEAEEVPIYRLSNVGAKTVKQELSLFAVGEERIDFRPEGMPDTPLANFFTSQAFFLKSKAKGVYQTHKSHGGDAIWVMRDR